MLCDSMVPLALGDDDPALTEYSYDYTDAPTASPAFTDAPTMTNAPTRTET